MLDKMKGEALDDVGRQLYGVGRHPAASIPLAVERVLRRFDGQQMQINPRNREPGLAWWAKIRAEVSAECGHTLRAFEPGVDLSVTVVDVVETLDPAADAREKAAAFDVAAERLARDGVQCSSFVAPPRTFGSSRSWPYLQIQIAPLGASLDGFRLYALRCSEYYQLLLEAVSYNAQCEAIRSLYAPEAGR